MKQLSVALTDYILKKNAISTEDYDIYLYGFQRFLELSVNVICSACIAFILHMEIECLLFFLFFIPLRSYNGGLHLKTYYSCLFFSCFTLSIILITIKFSTIGLPISFSLYIITLICIKLIGAVNHPNRPVNSEENAHFIKKSNFTFILSFFASIIFIIIGSRKFLLLEALVYLLVLCTLIIGRLIYHDN